MLCSCELDESAGHEDGEGDEMYSFESLRESFIVSGESSEACGPGEGAFDDPPARQQHEASFGHGVLDDLEPYAVLLCGGGGVWSGVSLVDVG